MAQTDTGLGWSAKDVYLRNTYGVAGLMVSFNEISNADFTLQPLPKTGNTFSEIVAGGLLIADVPNSNWYKAYASANTDFVFVCNTNYATIAISPTQNARCYVALYRGSSSNTYRDEIRCSTRDSATGLYYGTSGVSGYYGAFTDWVAPIYTASTTITGNVHPTKTIATILSEFSIASTSYYKLNSGYAVACLAKYHNEYGSDTYTPVLISTDSSATILSTDGTTPSAAVTYSYVKDGMRFYMTMIPSNTATSYTGLTVEEANLFNFPVLVPNGVFNAICSDEWANVRILESRNPYGEPTSDNAGGDGEDDTGDAIPFSTTPTTSAVSSGFLTLFMPNILTLNSLAGYMWSSPLFDPSTIKKLFADPMDAILSLHIVPVKPSTSGTKTISVAGIATDFSSAYTTEQFITVNCGSIYIPKKFGSYLDYSPYTQIEIFLPFIGFKPIDIDDVQGKTVYLQYQVDILSGACIAELKASMDDANSSVIYSWSGNCAVQIPVTGADFKSAFATAVTAAASLGVTVATGGSTAPLTMGTLASASVNSTGLKPRVQRSGAMVGSAGFMGQRIPFIVRSNPNIALPPRQEHYTGYPAFDTLIMSSLTGYNVVAEVHLEGIPATDDEMDEIERLLKEGVIF